MTNVPILIFGLLCGLPIIYVASFFVILAKIAHKNKVTFSKVIQHFYKKMSIKNVAMYAAITSAIALCINFIFTANNDGGFISFLVNSNFISVKNLELNLHIWLIQEVQQIWF